MLFGPNHLVSFQTCLNADKGHHYVPLEDLIKILTSEKDAPLKTKNNQNNEGQPMRRFLDDDQKTAYDNRDLQKAAHDVREEVIEGPSYRRTFYSQFTDGHKVMLHRMTEDHKTPQDHVIVCMIFILSRPIITV